MFDPASKRHFTGPSHSRLAIFATVTHIIVIGCGVCWGALRFQQREFERLPPSPNREPLIVRPQFNLPEVISDEDLQFILHKLRPRLRQSNPQVNHLDHALRMWGTSARFSDPECYSGQDLRELLLDARQLSQVWTPGTKPLLQITKFGLQPRVQTGGATSSHEDHTLACLAEVGTPLDFPVQLMQEERKVRDLYSHAFRTFSFNQTEYEWSTLVFALYSPTSRSWFTSEGQRISFDDLAVRIMRQKWTQGVCAGNHRLHTLAMLLRVHEQSSILSTNTRSQILNHLEDATRLLERTQDPSGCWETNWDGIPKDEEENLSPLTRKILATGHAMEWWALAPASVHPKTKTLVSASRWLVSTIRKLTDREVKTQFTFLTHAGRALALWRGKFPAEAYQAPLVHSITPQKLVIPK